MYEGHYRDVEFTEMNTDVAVHIRIHEVAYQKNINLGNEIAELIQKKYPEIEVLILDVEEP